MAPTKEDIHQASGSKDQSSQRKAGNGSGSGRGTFAHSRGNIHGAREEEDADLILLRETIAAYIEIECWRWKTSTEHEQGATPYRLPGTGPMDIDSLLPSPTTANPDLLNSDFIRHRVIYPNLVRIRETIGSQRFETYTNAWQDYMTENIDLDVFGQLVSGLEFNQELAGLHEAILEADHVLRERQTKQQESSK